MSLNLLYTVQEGFKGLKRHRFSSFITVSTIAVTLSLLGSFLVLTYNAGRVVELFKEKMELEIFLDNSLNKEDIDILQHKITKLKEVEKTVFISKEQALEEFKKEFNEDVINILGENPLPSSIRIQPEKSYRTAEGIGSLEKKLITFEGIEDVVYHGKLYRTIDKYSRIGFIVSITIFIIVLLSSTFLIANTMRLTILSQKKLIIIMKLVGATKGFIRRPYLIQGLFHGLTGGSISFLVIYLIMKLLNAFSPGLIIAPSWVLFFPIFLGLIMGIIGSFIGVKRFLKL